MNIYMYLTPRGYTSWKGIIFPLLFGPIAFTSMYFYMLHKGLLIPRLRGLFEFHSTTLGDFIILPLTWILMSRYYQLTHRQQLNRKPLLVVAIISTAGLATTSFVLSGIYGDYRDWTLPSNGTINFPGIYHASFMGFMIAIYALFIFDHWYLTSRIKDPRLKIKTSELYWYVINLLSIFVAIFWSDWFYEGKRTNYFLVNIPQQVGWALLLSINIIATLKHKLPPYNNVALWLGKETAVIFLALFIGLYLSAHPIFW